jgi:hypothetical protein
MSTYIFRSFYISDQFLQYLVPEKIWRVRARDRASVPFAPGRFLTVERQMKTIFGLSDIEDAVWSGELFLRVEALLCFENDDA